jgi:hypothetical protein
MDRWTKFSRAIDRSLRVIGLASVSVTAGGFYGFIASVGGHYLFHLSEDAGFLFVGLPVCLILTLVVFFKLPFPK